jgi:hypothetical protein
MQALSPTPKVEKEDRQGRCLRNRDEQTKQEKARPCQWQTKTESGKEKASAAETRCEENESEQGRKKSRKDLVTGPRSNTNGEKSPRSSTSRRKDLNTTKQDCKIDFSIEIQRRLQLQNKHRAYRSSSLI